MLLYGSYKPQRIHKGGTPIANWATRGGFYYLSEHTPLNSVNVIIEQRHF